MHRHCNLPSAKCNIPSKMPKPPAWVINQKKDPHRIILPDLQFFEPAPVQNPVPKRRIVGKQTVSSGQSDLTPCAAASSSDTLPRTSVPLEGFGGMPKTLRQAPTTSGIQQASGIMAYVDSVHSGGDVGIGDVTVHTHALYGLIYSTLCRKTLFAHLQLFDSFSAAIS